MKADLSRLTFDPAKHYSGVVMQQGRVQLDADWNEQASIHTHRDETTTGDLVGEFGVPLNDAGFGIVSDPMTLEAQERERLTELDLLPLEPGDFLIGAGRAYIDGVLCENNQDTTFTKQPDLPGVTPIASAGLYLAYLRAWQHHVTALDDPAIREVALGGPDHATRTKTVWQVGVLKVAEEIDDAAHCRSPFEAWDNLVEPPTGRLTARGEPASGKSGPCIVSPEAGYQRLENQLYRVEIHRGGVPNEATFKWSRINGSCVRRWTGQQGANNDHLVVEGTGPDDVLGFAGGGSVELTDDTRDLLRQPGTIVKLDGVDGDTLVIVPGSRLVATDSILLAGFANNPKIRRWDSPGEIKVEVPEDNGGFIPLEDGVEVRFEANETYRSGDYWLIPARTITGDIEWPRDENEVELPQPPHGIEDHFCRLALLEVDPAKLEADGFVTLVPKDCRLKFPPVTALTSLFYVGGDGQEVAPSLPPSDQRIPLPHELQVGVANGTAPVGGATVQFEIVENEGTGLVSNQKKFLATTDTKTGIASCPWEVDSFTPVQRVEATLLDAAGLPIHLPIRFTARLSTASAVAYDPSACTDLKNAGVTNVQQAIDALCAREGPAKTPGIVIVDIRLLNPEQALANNDEVVWQLFLNGFSVTVDKRLDPATISRPTCYVTIEMPFPLGTFEQRDWGNPFVGYRPLTLDATLDVAENRVFWVPAQDNITREFIGQLFNMMSEYGLEQRILARFTLKGNFIHDEGPRLYLDGEAFGLPPGRSEHNLTLPSGDGRRGGDFEMWFWLNNRG